MFWTAVEMSRLRVPLAPDLPRRGVEIGGTRWLELYLCPRKEKVAVANLEAQHFTSGG
jgi:hypothetical protein